MRSSLLPTIARSATRGLLSVLFCCEGPLCGAAGLGDVDFTGDVLAGAGAATDGAAAGGAAAGTAAVCEEAAAGTTAAAAGVAGERELAEFALEAPLRRAFAGGSVGFCCGESTFLKTVSSGVTVGVCGDLCSVFPVVFVLRVFAAVVTGCEDVTAGTEVLLAPVPALPPLPTLVPVPFRVLVFLVTWSSSSSSCF